MRKVQQTSEALDQIFAWFGNKIRIGIPLGLGKPNFLLNSLYTTAKQNSQIDLTLFTALSLEIPSGKTDLEKKFLGPFVTRHFGKDYPSLEYIKDLLSSSVPPNIKIKEFYLQPGLMIPSDQAQQNHVNVNYTHAAQAIFNDGLNVIAQIIAKRQIHGVTKYSLSCNPDLTLDLMDLFSKANRKCKMIGVVCEDLPYLEGDAEVPENFFDLIVEDPNLKQPLYGIPREPVGNADYMIGLHASRLIVDGGTLQIGIGSLSEALVYCTLLRHQKNPQYKKMIESFASPPSLLLENEVFQQGLYGTSEMVMDGFMYLRKNGILTRTVKDGSKNCFLHGAFILGSKSLYDWLRHLSNEDSQGINMTRVSKVNDLYDENEMALRKQRIKARFFNTCMQVTLLGGAASDTLENGRVVSGVGGQYNFVAMAHELSEARSVLMLRSTRFNKGKKVSNIVWSHGQLTIPRHLRDLVVTEYGIADIRGKSDQETIAALIEIADSEFQEKLLADAKQKGKIEKSYEIPKWAKTNFASKVDSTIQNNQELFPFFPFGSDFTPVEENVVRALSKLKRIQDYKGKLIKTFLKGTCIDPKTKKEELERMGLLKNLGFKDSFYQKLLLGVLS